MDNSWADYGKDLQQGPDSNNLSRRSLLGPVGEGPEKHRYFFVCKVLCQIKVIREKHAPIELRA